MHVFIYPHVEHVLKRATVSKDRTASAAFCPLQHIALNQIHVSVAY